MTKISPCFVLRLTWKITHVFFFISMSSISWRLSLYTLRNVFPFLDVVLLNVCSDYEHYPATIYILWTFFYFAEVARAIFGSLSLGGKNAFIFHSWGNHIGLGIPLKLFRWFSCLIMILLCLSPLSVCLKCAVKFLWTATEALNH